MMAMVLVEETLPWLWMSVVEKGILTSFFCQGGVNGLNDAVSVVRSLIHVLVDERRDLIHHVI